MHRRPHRFVVFAIAVAFIGSGFARTALGATPQEPCHPGAHESIAHHADGDHGEHAMHAHGEHAMHDDHQHDGNAGKAPTDQACFKCCGICTAVPIAAPIAA